MKKILEKIKKWQAKKELDRRYKKKIEELKKRDPFIYKH